MTKVAIRHRRKPTLRDIRGVLVHLFHRWETVEATGRVHVQRCSVCGKTRVRVR